MQAVPGQQDLLRYKWLHKLSGDERGLTAGLAEEIDGGSRRSVSWLQMLSLRPVPITPGGVRPGGPAMARAGPPSPATGCGRGGGRPRRPA